MRLDDGECDGETETAAAGLTAARFLDPVKRLEDLGKLGFRDSRPMVIDRDRRCMLIGCDLYVRRSAIFDGVIDQIVERTAKSGRLAGHGRRRGRHHSHFQTGIVSSDIRKPSTGDTENPATHVNLTPRPMPVRVSL